MLTDVHVRVDQNVKIGAEKVLKNIGISTSDYINMALRRVMVERGIPFDTRLPRHLPDNFCIKTEKDLDNFLDQCVEEEKTGKFYTQKEFYKLLELDLAEIL